MSEKTGAKTSQMECFADPRQILYRQTNSENNGCQSVDYNADGLSQMKASGPTGWFIKV
jgi:hypothetical protein